MDTIGDFLICFWTVILFAGIGFKVSEFGFRKLRIYKMRKQEKPK